jgi:SAM-dependent methyltransferase
VSKVREHPLGSQSFEPKQRPQLVRAGPVALYWQKAISFAVERYLRISTAGHVSAVTKGGVHYTPLPYRVTWQILRHLNLQSDDVFVDIGCGKGRVLCCAARTAVGRVVGIEVNDGLAKQARTNLRKLRGRRAPGEVLSMFAENFDYADASVIYLYNPFDETILRKTLARIDQAFKARPRPISVVYANNMYEEPLRELHWLGKQYEWPATDFPSFGYPIGFWRSV